jgi:hypothetical protein
MKTYSRVIIGLLVAFALLACSLIAQPLPLPNPEAIATLAVPIITPGALPSLQLPAITPPPLPGLTEEVPTSLQCQSNKLDYPIPADAEQCITVLGSAVFRTRLTPEAVQNFYADYLTANGWKKDNEETVIGIITVWSKGTARAQIAALVEKGMTSVNVTVVSK